MDIRVKPYTLAQIIPTVLEANLKVSVFDQLDGMSARIR